MANRTVRRCTSARVSAFRYALCILHRSHPPAQPSRSFPKCAPSYPPISSSSSPSSPPLSSTQHATSKTARSPPTPPPQSPRTTPPASQTRPTPPAAAQAGPASPTACANYIEQGGNPFYYCGTRTDRTWASQQCPGWCFAQNSNTSIPLAKCTEANGEDWYCCPGDDNCSCGTGVDALKLGASQPTTVTVIGSTSWPGYVSTSSGFSTSAFALDGTTTAASTTSVAATSTGAKTATTTSSGSNSGTGSAAVASSTNQPTNVAVPINTGAIAGGVIAGVGALALIGALGWFPAAATTGARRPISRRKSRTPPKWAPAPITVLVRGQQRSRTGGRGMQVLSYRVRGAIRGVRRPVMGYGGMSLEGSLAMGCGRVDPMVRRRWRVRDVEDPANVILSRTDEHAAPDIFKYRPNRVSDLEPDVFADVMPVLPR